MKLLIQGDRIAGTATDDYEGPMDFIVAPEGFDFSRLDGYAVIDGGLVPRIPRAVTQRQARLMLHRAGVLTNAGAVIAAMPEPQRTEAQIEWEYASEILRDSPLVSAIGAALDLDDAALDTLFAEAARL